MNTEIFIVFLFLVFLFCLYKNKEGLRNPLIPPSFEFSVLTPPQEVMSGYYQEELCKNDPDWLSGNKRCHHLLDKDDCALTNNDGISANDACLIACDTCPSSVEIKFRDDNEVLEETLISTEDDNESEGESPSDYDILDIMDQIDKKMEKINLRFENSDLLISQNTDINEIEASIERLNYYNRQVSNRDTFRRTYWTDRQDEIKQGICDELANIIELSSGQNDRQIEELVRITRGNLDNLEHTCPINTPSLPPSSQSSTSQDISQTIDSLSILEEDIRLSSYCDNLSDLENNCEILAGVDAAVESGEGGSNGFNNNCKDSNSDVWSNCKETCCTQGFIPLDAWRGNVYTRNEWNTRFPNGTQDQYNSNSRTSHERFMSRDT